MKRNNKSNKGFTIIEVLIVLAIASSILLIVFLAVPALQRNQRNTQRKSAVAAVAAAVNEFEANNSGALPQDTSGTANPYKLCESTASCTKSTEFNLGYYSAKPSIDKNLSSSTSTAVAAVTSDVVTIVNKGKCTTTATASYGSERSVAILFAIESSGGYVSQCQDV